MNALEAFGAKSFASTLNQLRAYDRFGSGRRVLTLIALGVLAEQSHLEEIWSAVRNVAVHGQSSADQWDVLTKLARLVELKKPELAGVFGETLVPDLLQATGEFPGFVAIAGQVLEQVRSETPTSLQFGAWFDEALDLVASGRNVGEFATPHGLARLMARLAEPGSGDLVLDPCCGTGSILARMGDLAPELDLRGQDLSALAGALGRLRLYFLGQRAEVRIENALKTGVSWSDVGAFDRIVCNPPFGPAGSDFEDGLLKGRYPDLPFRYEALFLDYCRQNLAPGGRAVVLVPYPFLNRKGRETNYRRGLVVDGKLEGVIALPSGVVPWTDVPLALIVLRGQPSDDRRVIFVDAAFLKAAGRKAAERLEPEQIDELVRLYRTGDATGRQIVVDITAIVDADSDLQPSRYLAGDRPEPVDLGRLYAEARQSEAIADQARKAFDRLLQDLDVEGLR